MTAVPPAHRRFIDRLVVLESALTPAPPAEQDGLDDFRRLIMDRWDNLRRRLLGTTVDGFRALSAGQHALLQALVDSPDLLAPLQRDRDETTHTRLIAWALGLENAVGAACRGALARQLGLDTDSMEVASEVTVAPRCRVDLVLETPRCLVYVEAKVDARERPAQLADYRAALDARAGRRRGVLVFLTVDGPAETSADRVPLTFAELLSLWLPATLLPGADAQYLASYLVSVAGSLCGALEPGPFATWSLQAQRRMLALLNAIEESDVPSL